MRFLIRAFLFLLLRRDRGGGGAYFYRRPDARPGDRDRQAARSSSGARHAARGRRLGARGVGVEARRSCSSRTASRRRSSPRATRPAPRRAGRGRSHRHHPRARDGRRCPTSSPARRASSSRRRGPCSAASGRSNPRPRRDLQVRLERPRVSVVSTHHYVNLGGTEMVRLPRQPGGRRVGRARRRRRVPRLPGHRRAGPGRLDCRSRPARGLLRAALRPGRQHADARLRARRGRQQRPRRLRLHRTFPKPFKRSRIELDDKFLDRVVPAILEGTPEVKPEGDTLAKFLVINGELRRKNAEKIASMAKQTSPEMLWGGIVFHPFTQQRRRVRVRRPAHLRLQGQGGRQADPPRLRPRLDCRQRRSSPPTAARCSSRSELGIYGNCVIIDHGMGVQSLYAHLSSIGVKAGDMVEKEQVLGRSGMTGLAGGDHLHFTMLVNGTDGEPGRVVGPALDRGPDPAQAPSARRRVAVERRHRRHPVLERRRRFVIFS